MKLKDKKRDSFKWRYCLVSDLFMERPGMSGYIKGKYRAAHLKSVATKNVCTIWI